MLFIKRNVWISKLFFPANHLIFWLTLYSTENGEGINLFLGGHTRISADRFHNQPGFDIRIYTKRGKMKAQITRNSNHVVVGTYSGFSLSGLADWVLVFVKEVTLGSLAILWFLAQRDKTLKEIKLGDFTVTLDGS